MKMQYTLVMFLLCFFVWAIVVDNAIVPSMSDLSQSNGLYSRYRVKQWNKGRKLDVLQDELLVYAYIDDREQLFYMEKTAYFEATLQNIPKGTPVQLRYSRRFPKVWKRHLYDARQQGVSFMRYSPSYLREKQAFIWKFTGIMGGIFLFLALLGLIKKTRAK